MCSYQIRKNKNMKNVLAVLSLFALLSGSSQAATYTITDLGTLGFPSSYAYSINNSGQIVGQSGANVFLYSNGTMGSLGIEGRAFDINNSGQVVGNFMGAAHGFFYSNGVTTDLGNLGGGYANAINDAGQVVGYRNFDPQQPGQQHAFLWNNGSMTDLGTLGGSYSFALDINTSGQVAGSAYTTGNAAQRAFIYSNGVMTDIGTLGGTGALALGINDSGQVVGSARTGGNAALHPYIWTNGSMIDLGTLGGTNGYAYSINSSGQVVGRSHVVGDVDRAFLYSDDTLYDLNSLLPAGSLWTLQIARSINEAGQIVGHGMIQGEQHAFLMTPVAVPEPATFWLLGSGLFGLIGVAWRKRK